jgi:hypothetical protein
VRRRRHEPIGAQRCADGGDGGVHLDGGEADRSAEQAARLDLEGIGGGDGGCEGGCDGGGYRVGGWGRGGRWIVSSDGLGSLELLPYVTAGLGEADCHAMGCQISVGGDDDVVMCGDGVDGSGEGGEEEGRGEAGCGEDGAVGGVGWGLDAC